MLRTKSLVNSIFNSLTYVLWDDELGEAVIVDCGDAEPILEFLSSCSLRLKAVFLTHSHYDHIYGLKTVLDAFPEALVYTSNKGKEGLRDPRYNYSRYHENTDDFIFEGPQVRVLEDESVVEVLGLRFKALSTPGHDLSSMSYLAGDLLFTGDSYIPGVKVITTLRGGDKAASEVSLARLRDLESSGARVLPGHMLH